MDSSGALFSSCRNYRYKLYRKWSIENMCMFLMLNPSTADEVKNDPTVERCERFARSWGYGGLYVGNIFAYRATAPVDMKSAKDPVGDLNDRMILEMARQSKIVVCAWGNHGSYLNRSSAVLDLLKKSEIETYCLKINKATQQPSHPLYLPKKLKPIRYAYN